MSNLSKFVLGLGCAALYASAAVALPIVSYVDQTTLYNPSTVQAAGFNVEVHGTPAPGMDAAAALAGLRGPAWVGGTPLKPLPADARPGEGTRLVLIFNGAGAPSEIACSEPGALGGGNGVAGGSLHVLAVYCAGDRMVARGALTSASVTGPGDEGYRAAMQTLLTTMFPPINLGLSPMGGI